MAWVTASSVDGLHSTPRRLSDRLMPGMSESMTCRNSRTPSSRSSRPQKAGRAEVEQGDTALAQVGDVGRMGIAVEEAVLEDLLEPAVGHGRGQTRCAPRGAEPAMAGLLRVGPSMRSMVSTRLVRVRASRHAGCAPSRRSAKFLANRSALRASRM